MPPDRLLIYFFIAIIMLLLNRLCTSINLSFSRIKKNQIEKDENDKFYYKKTSAVLAATQFCSLICSAIYGISIYEICLNFYEIYFKVHGNIFTTIAVYIVCIYIFILLYWTFSMKIPGVITLNKPIKSRLWSVKIMTKIFNPFTTSGFAIVKLICKYKKVPFNDGTRFIYTEEELRSIIEESHSGGRLNALENILIKNSFDFFDLITKDVMIPRNKMVTLDYDDDIETMHRIIAKSHHTRYPVYIDDKDSILGFIHVKDFMENTLCGQNNMKHILREILTVPEVMPASSLLQLMKTKRVYLAIVVDEYGSTAGLVTLEDLVEELVGQIPEEDSKTLEILKVNETTYEFDGMVILNDVSERLGINFDGDSTGTIGGFVFARLERIPKFGDCIFFSGWKFTVLKMEGFRVTRIRAEKIMLPKIIEKENCK
ncbi:hemolysin family protein [Dialister micraerophilus]|uniref:hemolysin family protein n=1 Tax=Dialister micraerophilus TaxID=309120 RepID=UPI0023F299B9|nr:hemolysin family protein [Dialister micraerophilus]MDK8253026.1 hemolysin family protein [Dialister micraerophilus]